MDRIETPCILARSLEGFHYDTSAGKALGSLWPLPSEPWAFLPRPLGIVATPLGVKSNCLGTVYCGTSLALFKYSKDKGFQHQIANCINQSKKFILTSTKSYFIVDTLMCLLPRLLGLIRLLGVLADFCKTISLPGRFLQTESTHFGKLGSLRSGRNCGPWSRRG